MDDLLIVRVSDRSKERFSRKRRKMNAPVGMNLGLVLGVGVGAVIATQDGANPLVSMGMGIGFGVVFGALTGRFLRPIRRYKRIRPSYSYEGMPFETKEESDSEDEAEPKRS